MVDLLGLEPKIPDVKGRCPKPLDDRSDLLVGKERLELSILSAAASKTAVYPVPPLARLNGLRGRIRTYGGIPAPKAGAIGRTMQLSV